MKHRISLIEEVQTETTNGFKQKEWVEVKKTWSDIHTYQRSKKVENDKEFEEVTIVFTLRYQTINKNHRIRYQGKDFIIQSVQDKTFEKRFLEVSASEVV
ncbi:phage head closure protein [Mesobacillus persicus]|uniref:phage head closure protein n=1 Tax=Mesobacillus persicus TaxID=930146 RepID=UPI0014812FE0|nr:phage head closure protein [Mesobacillus persicus]